jgi:hypothetical protein
MTEETAIPPVPAEKLVRVYLKMKTAKVDLEAQVKKIDTQMDQVKAALLAYCKEQSIESVRTTEGLFYRSIKKRYTTNNWEAMGKFVLEHQIPELYEKRLHQGNIQQFLEEHPDLLPPGLNVDSEYTITVRKE